MTLYKAMFSLPKHPFGTVQDLDPADPVVAQRVKSGMLVPVVPPGATTPVWAAEAPVEALPVETPLISSKPAPKKRAARKKPEPQVETPNPQVQVEGSEETAATPAQPDTITVEAPSSVMTSWNLSD